MTVAWQAWGGPHVRRMHLVNKKISVTSRCEFAVEFDSLPKPIFVCNLEFELFPLASNSF